MKRGPELGSGQGAKPHDEAQREAYDGPEEVSRRFDRLGQDGAPVRLGLLGGTFDPIHIGHLRIAEEVREALHLDAVLFIPAGTPVFKRDKHVTDARQRCEWVRRAVADNPHFDMSPIEVRRDGDTYTVDTLRQLRRHYPENVQFYFIVGADAAETVGKWRGCAELAQLTHLAVAAGRPGFARADELRQSILDAAPFDLHMVQVSSLEVSSSDIRDRMAAGQSVRYLLPPALQGDASVLQAFRKEPGSPGGHGSPGVHGEASGGSALQGASSPTDDAIGNTLSKAFFKARKAQLKQRVSAKRFEHSLGVSDTCVQLAKLYGVDVKKARLAGLLHDWDKGMDDDQARARVRQLGMEDRIDPYTVETMPRVLHGMTAACALGREFPGIPADVLQAISRHTTAAPDMSPLDMVLYIADAIEPSRQFGRIDDLRAAVGQVSLDELYFRTYEYWVFLLFDRRKTLHPDTIRIWNSYVESHPRHAHPAPEGKHAHSKGKHKQ